MTLVSIIIPMHNSDRFITEALQSVQDQTMQDWEAIVIDDASTDDTVARVKRFLDRDKRFRLIQNAQNMGAAVSRNRGLSLADGRYIAYLDSDDFWMPAKLERQIKFMDRHEISSCFTSYETVNEDGSYRNTIHVDPVVNYERFLKKPPTCSHTILFDSTKVSKELLIMPDIRKRQDAATWLNVIKHCGPLYGFDEVLAANRKRPGSLSSNKFSAMKNTWLLYTKIESLNPIYAAYCLSWQMVHAASKRLGHF